MNLERKRFGDLFEFAGKSKIQAKEGLSEGNYPFYTSSNILSKYINEYLYSGESLIFGTGGKPSIHFQTQNFATSTDCLVAQPKNKNEIFTEYCFYFIQSNLNILEDGFHGAGLKHISKSYISDIKIPLPSISEQKHIAEVLSKAEALIAERKQSIQLLDEYLKSTFLEMFGDPVKNEKGWEKVKLETIANKITDGKHGDCVNEENSGYYFLSAKDLVDGELKYKDVRQITKADFDEVDKRTSLKVDDILLGNTGASIGKIGIVKNNEFVRRTVFQKSISIITLKTEICIPIFLKSYLEVDRGLFNKTSTGSAMPNLLLSQIRNFQIFIPPLSLQTQFAAIVEKTEALKTQYKEHLKSLEQMYGALSQRAFRGELTKTEIKRKEKV